MKPDNLSNISNDKIGVKINLQIMLFNIANKHAIAK